MSLVKRVENYSRRQACDCQETTLRYRQGNGGAKQFVHQCRRCGKCSSALKLTSLGVQERRLALPIDATLARQWQERADAQFWARYEEYLRSADWLAKRARVLERDGHLCQACRECRASQVHHLTYERVFREPLFDLTSVCNECHLLLHGSQK